MSFWILDTDHASLFLTGNKPIIASVAKHSICSIAMNAAFLAADAFDVVTMYYMLQAAKSEYIKLERSLTDTEVKGWV